MFEAQTYETILQRMLDRVPDDLDKREGSLIYDALAPTAAELAQSYIELDTVMKLTFAKTSGGEFLDLRTGENGVKKNLATPAIRKGMFNIDVPLNSRFRGGEVIYKAVEKTALGNFKLEAETAGGIGNEYFGALLPLENIDGLTSAVLSDVLIPGEDPETDEALYSRFLTEINAVIYGGNIDQYADWIGEIAGVGRFKTFPLWNGRGTVKAVITDAGNGLPNQVLVDTVQNTLDPDQDGQGAGLVPIGHVFTASAATGKVIAVSVTIAFKDGYGPPDIQADVEQLLDTYFSEINFVDSSVRQAVISSRIIGLTPVEDVTAITLNGVDGNVALLAEEIAVRGVVNIASA